MHYLPILVAIALASLLGAFAQSSMPAVTKLEKGKALEMVRLCVANECVKPYKTIHWAESALPVAHCIRSKKAWYWIKRRSFSLCGFSVDVYDMPLVYFNNYVRDEMPFPDIKGILHD